MDRQNKRACRRVDRLIEPVGDERKKSGHDRHCPCNTTTSKGRRSASVRLAAAGCCFGRRRRIVEADKSGYARMVAQKKMVAHQLSLDVRSTGFKTLVHEGVVTRFQSIILRDSTSNSSSGVVPPETASTACPRSAIRGCQLVCNRLRRDCASSVALMKSCRSDAHSIPSRQQLERFLF